MSVISSREKDRIIKLLSESILGARFAGREVSVPREGGYVSDECA